MRQERANLFLTGEPVARGDRPPAISPFSPSQRSPDQFGPSPFPEYESEPHQRPLSPRSLIGIVVIAVVALAGIVMAWRFMVGPVVTPRAAPTPARSAVASPSPANGQSASNAPSPAASPRPSPLPSPSPTRVPVSLANGTEITPPRGERGLGKLTIKNGTTRDAAAKLVTGSADPKSWQTRRFVYVRANDTVTIENIAAGTYRLAFIAGVDWDESGHRFLREVSASLFDETFEFKEEPVDGGTRFSTWDVSLNPVVGGTGKTTVLPEGAFGSD